MKSPAKISVIIPTVNAHSELDLALSSLTKNSDHPLEIIILVDPDPRSGKLDQKILKVCKKHVLQPTINQKNLGPYGSWNKGASLSTTDYLIFATDDQYFAPHWDSALLSSSRPKRLVAGRLVEPGIIPVYPTNIKRDFGIIPAEFREAEFLAFCQNRQSGGFVQGGFFIPLLVRKSDFRLLGDFPTVGSFGTRAAVSNDYAFVQAAIKKGFEFGTADSSLSYHFQGSSWKKKTIKPTIAAVVLTKNNASTLTATLDSLSWVNAILVVDAGSTDETTTIAKKSGAKVLNRPFDDFAKQRNFALTHVFDYDWVFMLDSDEVCEPELTTELKSAAQDIYLDGVMVKRKNYIWGKWIKHSDWYPDERLVFFRPQAVTFQSGVHERATFIKGGGHTVSSVSHILHYNYATVAEFVTKNLITYPAAYAQELKDKGVDFSAVAMLKTSLAEFMRRYFLARGYQDGMHGFLLSSLMGLQQFVSYVYLWELTGKTSDFTVDNLKSTLTELRSKIPEFTYWLRTVDIDQSTGLKKNLLRLKRKTLRLVKGL